jgi:hypothetical protein
MTAILMIGRSGMGMACSTGLMARCMKASGVITSRTEMEDTKTPQAMCSPANGAMDAGLAVARTT